MSLDNIQLPPAILPGLYKKSLISLDADQQITATSPIVAWPRLGKNKRSVLIIVDEKDVAFLSDNDLKFLVGILNACRLGMEDITLVNYNRIPGMNAASIAQQFAPDTIIFFGIEPAILDFPLQFPQYKLQAYSNQTYLYAATLSRISKDKEQKTLLWNCLKTLFSIA